MTCKDCIHCEVCEAYSKRDSWATLHCAEECICFAFQVEAQIKSKAIKEFAERLKEKAITYYTIRGLWVSVKDINEIVKEMVGDTECQGG